MGNARTGAGATLAVVVTLMMAAGAARQANAASGAPDLDRQFWAVTGDSTENQSNYSPQAAIDGDSATFWHTTFSPSPHPHWLSIDLLRNAEVEGFRYQGRPDGTGVPNGRVGNWALYLSETPANWTTLAPVATGSFPDDSLEHTVMIPAGYGRYLTFVALSEAGNRGGWTTIAEFNIMGRFRDVNLQAIENSVPSWQPIVDDLSSSQCSISPSAGIPAIRDRAWVDPTCSLGRFDTAGLAPGNHWFEYQIFDGSNTRRGRVTITVRPPMKVYDSSWAIPLKASDADIEAYFTYLESTGYAGLWISLVPTVWQCNPAAQCGLDARNPHGDAFGSFDNPNPAYLEHVDHILDAAAAHNLVVNIVVAWAADWVGERPSAMFHGIFEPAPIHEGNGAAFGQTLANRWKGHPALAAWVMGGDWWTPESEAATEPTWDAIVDGIRSTGASEPMTYHTGGFISSWLLFSDRDWVDFLSPETSHCILPEEAEGILTMLRVTYGKDVVSAEMRYEDEPTQARGVSAWCYPEGPAVGFIGEAEIAADALATYNAGATTYVYGHDTRWNWGNGLATLGQPGEAAAIDVAHDGMLGGDTVAPGWPGGSSLNGSATNSSSALTWSSATDDTGVVLYRISDATRGVMARVTGRSATITGLQGGTTYRFTVEAVDALGNSTAGPQLVITTTGQPPTVPPGDRVGLFDPATGVWYLRHSPLEERSFYYGNPGDVPLLGDWDGDGDDTPGMYRPSTGFAYLTNQLPADGSVAVADPDLTFFFGIPGDQVVVGDWDGNGTDTLGIRRADKMFLTDVNATSTASREFYFGVAGDMAVGGRDSVFLYRPSNGFVYYTTAIPTGTSGVAPTSGTLFYGLPTDRFIVGDWDANGSDTVGVFRPADRAFYLRNSNTTGPADQTFPFGRSAWLPTAGHF